MPDNKLINTILGTPNTTITRVSAIQQKKDQFVYNGPINRSRDLLNQNILQFAQAGKQFQRSFYITPPRETMNQHAVSIIKKLAADLSKIDQPPAPELGVLVRRYTVEELLANTTSENKENALLQGIQQSPAAGQLLAAANRLNTKVLSPTDRFLLSHEGIFVYVLFLLNQGLGMSDEEVLLTNILPSLQRIKQYANVRIAEKVIEAQHLDAGVELPIVKERIKNLDLPYQGIQIENIILKEFGEVSQGGALLQDVIDFLNTDQVPIPEDIGRERLIEEMVKFLSNLGIQDLINEEVGTDGTGGTGSGDGTGTDNKEEPKRPVPGDNLEKAIKGIGEGKYKQLSEAGIITFSQLATITVSDLKDIISPQVGFTLEDYIKQAELISKGEFKELSNLQESLPRRSGIN